MTRAERIARNRARHERRADNATAKADARFSYVRTMADVMQGEPVKVGHHSERRHRRDLARVDSAMSQGVKATRQAERSQRLADSAEHTGISAADDDARELLTAKIARLKQEQERDKAVNRIVRSKPKNQPTEAKRRKLETLLGSCSDETLARLCEVDYGTRAGIPGYVLSNRLANIKRCEKRQAELEQRSQIADAQVIASGTCEGKAFEFITDTDDDRLRFESPRLSQDACKLLKRHGFKWSRTRGAWIRFLNQNAISAAAHYLAPALEKLAA